MKKSAPDRGLELTNNSKAGPSLSLSRSKSCINRTSECWRACYGHGIRYQSDGAKGKRLRNFETVEFLLDCGGPEAFAEHLIDLIDRARPSGWLIAKLSGFEPTVPWSLRLMDVGDFHRVEFVQAWILAARSRPECMLWWYTRSYLDNEMFIALSEPASSQCPGMAQYRL